MKLSVPPLSLRLVTMLSFCLLLVRPAQSRELNAKFTINRSQVANTKSTVFETLEKAVNDFLNDKQWTNFQYKPHERINCTFSLTVKTYSETDNSFTGTLSVQSTRPVYNSTYTTTVFSIQDGNCNFAYQEHDPLEFRKDQVDNNLTAMLAYYAYLLIGLDMDTMSPLGGTAMLQTAEDIVTASQNLGYTGWKAFDDNKNRFAIITDYMDGSLEALRQFNYIYYRKGLDVMAENSEQGRKAAAEAVQQLRQAYENKSLSSLPQIFTDIKRDEFVNLFSEQGTGEERQGVYDILFRINPSQDTYWEKIKR